MKSIYLVVALMSVVLKTLAQTANPGNSTDDVANVPLSLLINGSGSIYTFDEGKIFTGHKYVIGQMFEVGRKYALYAVPEQGFTFANWNLVNVFTFTEITVDTFDNLITNSSTVVSPVPTYTRDPWLGFTMPPVQVIYDVPGVRTITVSQGWQANFVPVSIRRKVIGW